MDADELCKCIERIEQYANELHSVSIGYSMSILSVAKKMREIIEGKPGEKDE